jgi:exoribonuclease II
VGWLDPRGPQLAVVEAERSGKVVLRSGWEARPVLAPPRELEAIASGQGSGGQGPAAPPWRLSRERLAAALPVPRELAAAWLLLKPQGGSDPVGSLSLVELADLLGSADDIALRAALWLWLQGEQSWFRWRQQRLEPRPLAEIQQRRRLQRRRLLQERRRHNWHRQILARAPLPPGDPEEPAASDLAQLRRWAAADCAIPLSSELLGVLQRAHCPAEPGAIRHLLVDLGQWSRHHLPALEQSSWSLGFSSELEQQAQRLVEAAPQPQPGDEQRLDLCGLHSITIDDEDTRDLDDALALEPLAQGGHALWVHIADPGRLVAAGSPLDLEARRRGSSLYLARGSLPMFPACLAHGPLSLRQGLRCAAWSLRLELDGEGAVVNQRLTRSWIRPAYRLSYADADELIELAPPQEPDLALLDALLERRRSWRSRRGALQLEQCEGRIRSEGELASLQIVEPSRSRRLVAEAMILVGAVIAELGQQQELALPYRSQPPAELPDAAELARLEAGPVRHAALRRCLSRGHMGVTPAPHFSLGLPAYVQATSPIRRYGDLLVQRQLQALTNGDEPLSAAAMADLLETIEAPLREGIRISRDDQRHWQQVWFEQNHRPSWRGLFLRWLRPQDQLGLVHLEDLCLELPTSCPASCEPGTALRVKVVEVDSLRDLLRLQASL